MKEKVEILIKLPYTWMDIEDDHGLGIVRWEIKDQVLRALKEALVEKYINTIELPEIKITKEEIKDRMLTILAERALENE